jgi:hypothetical protein
MFEQESILWLSQMDLQEAIKEYLNNRLGPSVERVVVTDIGDWDDANRLEVTVVPESQIDSE